MGAAHDRRAVVVPGPGRDHVADGVDDHVQAGVAHPHGDQVPALPVGISQRQTGTTASFESTDLAQLLEPVYKAVCIDPQGRNPGCSGHRSTITAAGVGCQYTFTLFTGVK